MGIVDLETLTQTGVEDNLNMNYYSISEDPVTGNLFAATADFVTNSQVYIYDLNNIELNSFTSGVTTNKIVFDVRSASTSIKESHIHQSDIIKRIDFLGRDIVDENFMINIYDDGTIDKKYILK